MDGCVSSGASLIQVFRRWRVVQREQRKKKRKKGKGREEGFFPFSSYPQHLFFFARFSLHRPTLSERLELGTFLAPADSAAAVRKNDSKAINVVTRDQGFFFFFLEGEENFH